MRPTTNEVMQEQVQVKVEEGLETVLKMGVDIQCSIVVYIERKKIERAGEMGCEEGVSIPKGPGVNIQWQNWQKNSSTYSYYLEFFDQV